MTTPTEPQALADLAAAKEEERQMEIALNEARERTNSALVRAARGGFTPYRMAKVMGISTQAATRRLEGALG